MDLDPSSFDGITAAEFARIVGGMSDKEIAATMRGEHRVEILEAIFGRFPDFFRPDRAAGVSQVTQFRVTGGPAAHPEDTFEVVIEGGRCWVSDEPGERYDVSLRMGPSELTKLLTGRGSATMLVMRGRISVRGDLSRAATFSSYFDLPKA